MTQIKKSKMYLQTRSLIAFLCFVFSVLIAPTLIVHAIEPSTNTNIQWQHPIAQDSPPELDKTTDPYSSHSVIIDSNILWEEEFDAPNNELVEKYKHLNDKELLNALQNLSKNEAEDIVNNLGERASSLPVIETSKIFGYADTMEFALSFQLSSLMYPESIEGVKNFQEDIGEEQTGVITFFQMEELTRRFNRTRESSVIASGTYFYKPQVHIFEDHVSVKGTWTMDNDIMGNPINVAKISCFKNHLECREIVADVTTPLINENNDSYYLGLNERTYKILSWSNDEIVSSRDDMCKISIMTMNFKNDEVIEIVRNKKIDGCFPDEYAKSDNFHIPQIYRLSPGFESTYNWWQKRKKETGKLYNQRYAKGILEKLSETGKPFNP